MRKKLTLKQAGFIKDLIKTKNGTKAVKMNYNVKNDNVAGNIASVNLRKPAIQDAIKPLLERMEKERVRILLALEGKNLSKEKLRDLTESFDKMTKNIQLLSGGKTENVGLETDRESLKEILKELRK